MALTATIAVRIHDAAQRSGLPVAERKFTEFESLPVDQSGGVSNTSEEITNMLHT